METSPEALFFSAMRQNVIGRNISPKIIKREKKRVIEQRKKNWASLGGQALHLLAARYSKNQEPTKATIVQMACLAHRLITVIPGLVLSPIAAALGGLKAQITASDAKILRSLKQKLLLTTLFRLNEKIEELYRPDGKTHQIKGSKNSAIYHISPNIYEDLKAILTYAKNFDEIHYERLKKQIERFEKFIELINEGKEHRGLRAKSDAVFIDPHGDDEI